jgi:signal transduction histidine kinase
MHRTTAEIEHPAPRAERLRSLTAGVGRPPFLSRPIAQDALLAGLLTATSLVGVLVHLHVDLPEGGEEATVRSLNALGLVLILLQTVPLTWRRQAPIPVLAVTMSALFVYSINGYFTSFAALGFLVALYTAAAYRERSVSIPAGIAAAFVVVLVLLMQKEPVEPDAILAECLIVGGAWFLGDGLRIRRGQVLMLEDRASRLEQEREERTERAVAEERRVIARELHDVVAHNVSVIVAQAGAAQQISASQPKEALTALGSIEHTGREALVEMRRLMGLLRPDAERVTRRSPQPGLHEVDTLVEQAREAGIPVLLTIEGEPRPLPVGLDLSAYRIVQEGLTNVLKHSRPSRVDVVVRYLPRSLELMITDDGADLPDEKAPQIEDDDDDDGTPRIRYGHLGMRERVALFGGELSAGPVSGGGYRVSATLPTDEELP